MLHLPSLLRHYKALLAYVRRPPRRYRELLSCAASMHIRSIVEVGVYTGRRATEMMNAARIHTPTRDIAYYGFDLFETLTPEMCVKEFSKMPLPAESIRTYLARTGANIQLFKGYSQETLPKFIASHREPIDLTFIDGGHMIETITSDWKAIRERMGPKSIVIFDDYYTNDPKDVQGIGCQTLIDKLDRSMYDVWLSRTEDRFEKPFGVLGIRLAFVRLRHSSLAQ